VPARGLSDVTMERLLAASQEGHCSVFAAMKNPEVQAAFMSKTRESIASFLEFIERTRVALQVRSVTPCTPSDALPAERRAPSDAPYLQMWAEQFLSDIGYLDELRRSEKNPENAESRIRNLKELIVTLDGGSSVTLKPAERLSEFLEELTLENDLAEDEEPTGDAVTLITMHSCKGLEFPHVYVVGMEDGLLPHSRSKVEGTLDEERRLFYVAITRAMRTLTLSYCLGRKKYGQTLPCHPSPFLKELPEELVEHADEKGKQPVAVESGKNLFAGVRAALG